MRWTSHSVSWRLYSENALVLSGFPECFSRAYIYTRTHNEERSSDAKTTRAGVSWPEFVSVGVVSRITRPPKPTYTPTPFPEGLTWRQCHPRLPLSRVTACPLVCAVRAHLITSAQQKPFVPNSPSFLHSPSFVRVSTSSHTLCSACRDRSPLSHAILGAGHFDFHRREYLLAASNSALEQAERGH